MFRSAETELDIIMEHKITISPGECVLGWVCRFPAVTDPGYVGS